MTLYLEVITRLLSYDRSCLYR